MIKEGPLIFVLVLGIYAKGRNRHGHCEYIKNMEFYLWIVVSVLTLSVDLKKFISVE